MTREEEIEQRAFVYYETCSDEDIAKSKGFIDGAKWADKTMIEKVCKYLRTHLWQSIDDDNDPIVESVQNITLDNFIKDFKRYLDE
jgi:hypothetical protein